MLCDFMNHGKIEILNNIKVMDVLVFQGFLNIFCKTMARFSLSWGRKGYLVQWLTHRPQNDEFGPKFVSSIPARSGRVTVQCFQGFLCTGTIIGSFSLLMSILRAFFL